MPLPDGFSVLEFIKTNNINIKIIVVTASVLDESRNKCRKLCVNYFINKPIKLIELRETLAMCELY